MLYYFSAGFDAKTTPAKSPAMPPMEGDKPLGNAVKKLITSTTIVIAPIIKKNVFAKLANFSERKAKYSNAKAIKTKVIRKATAAKHKTLILSGNLPKIKCKAHSKIISAANEENMGRLNSQSFLRINCSLFDCIITVFQFSQKRTFFKKVLFVGAADGT